MALIERAPSATGLGRVLGALPGAGAAMLPKLICPACWPAYTAALGALGVNFVDYTPYLLPMTVAFLVVAIGSLGLLARRRRRIEPFLLGLLAAVALLVGKFSLESDVMLYAGIVMLIGASLIPWRSKMPPLDRPACCND
jgi:mercuric ion transport protein